jgi:hypothetical protein
MLEPITIGIADSRLRKPEATMATILEVTVDELWIIAVANIPIKRAGKGCAVIRMMSLEN